MYSSTLPYFTGEEGFVIGQITPPGGLNTGEILSHIVEDALLNTGTNSYYRVEAENTTGETYSNRVGIFHFALIPGTTTTSQSVWLHRGPIPW